ncbi:MAG: hypothetical protein LBI05_10105 [Planctomycetaceae bacterium]|jgi:hypothetical protein|nr:hypothetical protein [Planctomycetaceae bacterium]
MDSKHRHELEQNELAKWIVAQYDWGRSNSSWLGYAVLAVLVAVAVFFGTVRVSTWNRAAAWKQYYAALHSEQSETDLELLAQTTSSIVGTYARLALAQRQLSEGCMQVFISKKEAIIALEKALASFQQVQKATNDPLILQQAGFGLGQCWETLAAARVGNDRTQAEEEYQKVIDRWGDSFDGKRAKKRLARLQQPETRTFLARTAEKTEAIPEKDDLGGAFGLSDPLEPAPIDFGKWDETNEEPKQATEPESQEE